MAYSLDTENGFWQETFLSLIALFLTILVSIVLLYLEYLFLLT